uniref:UPAR/Ly6 domain-containing protein n=1 Tax=Acanthochromis polyacanthus TaxID=80966 RepID=A0A3Q1FH01_9TELE
MKTVVLALLVLVVVSQSEALRCYCGGLRDCPNSIETCYGDANTCVSAIITAGSHVNRFKGCYRFRDCLVINRPPYSTASCCMTDLCNR